MQHVVAVSSVLQRLEFQATFVSLVVSDRGLFDDVQHELLALRQVVDEALPQYVELRSEYIYLYQNYLVNSFII